MNKGTKLILENSLISIGFIAVLWVVFAVDQVFPKQIFTLGIEPRTKNGLFGILFAPFLHTNFKHLLSNTFPLLPLMFYALAWGRRFAVESILFIIVIGGLGVWLISPPGQVHAGASGLVYGLVGLIIVTGFIRKDLFSMITSILVVFFYGGIAIDAFTGIAAKQGISWQGHLFGFIAGVTYAIFFAKRNKNDKTAII